MQKSSSTLCQKHAEVDGCWAARGSTSMFTSHVRGKNVPCQASNDLRLFSFFLDVKGLLLSLHVNILTVRIRVMLFTQLQQPASTDLQC